MKKLKLMDVQYLITRLLEIEANTQEKINIKTINLYNETFTRLHY